MNDEVVIVVDPGSCSVKAGYSGDDVPICVFPSCFSKHKTRLESVESEEGNGHPSTNSGSSHAGTGHNSSTHNHSAHNHQHHSHNSNAQSD